MASKYSQHAVGKIYPEQASLQWKKVPLYAIATLKKITNLTNRQLLSVYLNLGVIPFKDVSEKRTNATSDDLSKYQAVDPGNFVLNNQQAWRGSVGVSKFSGIVSPAYIVLSLSDEIEANFANYLFRNSTMVDQYLICSKGVGSIQRNLYWPYLKRVLVNIPSKIEQNRIARFLDYKCAQINKFIQKKKRLIELLKEQKRAIIYQTVTCGLDPNVRIKPSGVDWLDDIPEHWEIRKVTHLFKQIGSGTTPDSSNTSYYNGPYSWVMSGDLNDSHLCKTSRSLSESAISMYSTLKIYPENSLIIAMYGATIGKVALTKIKACTNQACCVLSNPIDTINMEYMLLLFLNIKPYLIRLSYGGGQPNINQETLRSLRIPIPPLNEQCHIVDTISSKITIFNQIISETDRQINLIQEYRTRLISDVVTGQIDVRNIEIGDIAEKNLIEEALEEDQEKEFLELVGAGDDD